MYVFVGLPLTVVDLFEFAFYACNNKMHKLSNAKSL